MTSITRPGRLGCALALAGLSLGVALPAAQAEQTAQATPVAPRAIPKAGAVVPDQDPFYAPPKGLGKLHRGQVVRVRTTTASGFGSDSTLRAWQLAYRTTDTHKKPELTVTTLIVPKGRWTGKGSRPIVSVQEPEDSTGTQCSPSYTIATGNDQTGPALNMQLLSAGYALAVPDHEGPKSEFLAGRQEGHAVLDGIRAVNSLKTDRHGFDFNLGKEGHPWGLTGYSGGANATAWAAQLMPSYAPHLDVKGAAIGGTPSDPIAVARYIDGGATAGFEFGAAYGVGLAYPESHIGRILNAQGKADFKKVANECETTILGQFALKKLAPDSTVADPLLYPPVHKALVDDTMGRSAPSIPIFDYHANTDEIVPVGQDDTLVKNWCARGARVDMLRDPAGEHVEEAALRAGDAASYLTARFAGTKAPSTC